MFKVKQIMEPFFDCFFLKNEWENKKNRAEFQRGFLFHIWTCDSVDKGICEGAISSITGFLYTSTNLIW